MIKRMRVGIIITVIAIISTLCNTSLSHSRSIDYNSSRESLLSLTPHDPIFIDNDLDFSDYGFPGNGTKTDPFIIEGYSFSEEAYSGIYIQKTNAHFTINNCYTTGYSIGIYIRDVESGTASVLNNICENNEDTGIVIQDTTRAKAVNNTCKYNIFAGILLLDSSETDLINNTCLFNYWGAGIETTSDSFIFNNEFNYNTGYGLVSNVCYGNVIANNSCTHNPTGVHLSTTDICIFYFNRIQKNDAYGIYLDYLSDGNLIHHNDFIRNNLAGFSQGFDDGENNVFYDSGVNEGNF